MQIFDKLYINGEWVTPRGTGRIERVASAAMPVGHFQSEPVS